MPMKLSPSTSRRLVASSASRCRSFAGSARTAVLWLLVNAAMGRGSAAEAGPVVAVAAVTRQDLGKDLSVQAEFRAYQEVDLHAKVAGYLQQIAVDIGDRVRTGDLIATLEVPELKEDLTRGAAAVQRAEANYKEAHVNFTRLANVNRTQPALVAQQDVDGAEARDAAASAAVVEAQAELEKYRMLDGYTRITAPFDGVITKRYADPGALIQAGTSSSTQAMPLVRISQHDRLRLDFPIAMGYAPGVAAGDPIEIDLGDNQALPGRIARFSRRIATDTRTMLAEAEVPNPDLKLIPGMYVTVRLKVDRRARALAVPVEAVAGTKEQIVYMIGSGQQIEERPVRLGIETPTQYEVLAGLQEGDLVLIGNRAQVQVGQKVTAKLVNPAVAP